MLMCVARPSLARCSSPSGERKMESAFGLLVCCPSTAKEASCLQLDVVFGRSSAADEASYCTLTSCSPLQCIWCEILSPARHVARCSSAVDGTSCVRSDLQHAIPQRMIGRLVSHSNFCSSFHRNWKVLWLRLANDSQRGQVEITANVRFIVLCSVACSCRELATTAAIGSGTLVVELPGTKGAFWPWW